MLNFDPFPSNAYCTFVAMYHKILQSLNRSFCQEYFRQSVSQTNQSFLIIWNVRILPSICISDQSIVFDYLECLQLANDKSLP